MPSTNPIVTVVGRVLDAQANRGIEATVLLWDVLEAPRSATRVVTDAGGAYAVGLRPADRYVVSINDAVFAATVIAPGKYYATDFLLNSDGCPSSMGLS